MFSDLYTMFLFSVLFFILLYMFYIGIIDINLIIIIGVLYLTYNVSLDYFNLIEFKLYFVIISSIFFYFVISINEDLALDLKFLYFIVLLGSMLIILSENLLVIYLGLELQTFSLFIMISSKRTSVKSNEGGLKYFILGALSSGILLMVLSMIYYNTGEMSLNSISIIEENSFNSIWKISILLAMFFKLSMFPLHFWIPDIYEASSNKTIGIIGTLPKISVLAFIIQLNIFSNLLMWCAVGSVIIGTFGALNQTKVKRLIAYSGISHIGLGLLTYSLFVKTGIQPSLLYITIYALGFIPIILLMSNHSKNSSLFIYELGNIRNINLLLGLSWSLLILSTGGLPPLSGFLIKWWVIWSLILNNYSIIAIICISFSAIGLGYYLRIVKINYFQKSSSFLIWKNILKTDSDYYFDKIIIGLGFYICCFLILNPQPMIMVVDYVIMSYF